MRDALRQIVQTTEHIWECDDYKSTSKITITRPRGVFQIEIDKLFPATKQYMAKFWTLVMQDATNKDEVIPIMISYTEFMAENLKSVLQALKEEEDEAGAKSVSALIRQYDHNLKFMREREGAVMKNETAKKIENRETEVEKTATKAIKEETASAIPDKKPENISDTRQKVTDAIMEQMKNGVVPWHKPWYSVAMNLNSKKPYSMLNQLLLVKAGYYMTFNQIQAAGGRVKKGEHSSMVTFWKPLPIKGQDEDTDEEVVKKFIPYLRYYRVFHESQIEGIEFPTRNQNPTEKMPAAESVAFDYLQREGIRLVSDSVQAAYSQNADYIRIPKVADFDDTANYYATLFHEMIHSTLHKKRLNREAGKTFGDDPYAKEELVAEIGAAILCNHVGIDPTKYLDNSAAYIKGWSSRFKEDKNLIITASKQAEKAAEYILYGKAKEETETGAKAA